MTKSLLKQGLNAFLLVAVAAFLLVVLYSAVGQQVFPRITEYRPAIERYLSEAIDADIHIGKLWGEMDVLTPALHLEELTFHSKDQENPQLFIAAIDAVLDPYQSLINLTPVFTKIRLAGVSVDLRSLSQKDVQQEAEEPEVKEQSNDSNQGIESLVVGLLLQHSVEVNGVSIMTHVNGQDRTLNLEHISLKGDGFHRLINGHIAYGEKEKQIKTGFRIYSEGNPYDLDTFYARGTIDLPRLDFAFWIKEFSDNQSLEQLDASAQLNFEFDKGLLQGARLSLATPNLQVANQPSLKQVNSTIWLKQNTASDWSLWLEKGSFTLLEKKWSLEHLGLKLARQADGNRWQIYARELDLKDNHRLLGALGILPEKLSSLLADMKPEGKLQNAMFVLTTKERADTEFTFASQMQDVSIEAVDGIPGINNLSGVVAANKHVGRVQFDGQDLALSIPSIYEQPLNFKQGQGQVEWFIEPKQIRVVGDGLSVNLADVEQVQGGFQLWLSQDDNPDRESQLLLNLSVKGAQASAHHVLVPQVLNEEVRGWLSEGIVSGQVDNGQLMLFTSINEGSPDPILELHLAIQDAQLKYLQDWPQVNDINAQLFIDTESVRVAVAGASSLGGNAHNSSVVFADDKNGKPALWVGLGVSGSAKEGLSYLTDTPLQEIVNGAIDDWQVSGKHKFAMGLKVPMADASTETDIRVDLTSRLAKNNLYLGDVDLTLKNTQGVVGYSSQKGLYSRSLTTELWNEKVNVNMHSRHPEGQMVSQLDIKGRLNTQGLKDWIQLGLLESLHGDSEISGQLVLDTRENETTSLTIHSDLSGISLNLPEPYGLAEQETKPLEFEMTLNEPLAIKLAYGQDMNLAISLKDGELYSGQVYLGQTEAYLPEEKGLEITGHLNEINAQKWLPVWERIQAADKHYAGVTTKKSTNESESPIRQILLSADAVSYDKHRFENIKLDARHDAGDWRFDIDAPLAKGSIVLPQNDILNADLEYVHIPEPQAKTLPAADVLPVDELAEEPQLALEKASEQESVAVTVKEPEPEQKIGQGTEEESNPLAGIDPKALPPLRLKVGEIFVGATNYGKWDLVVKPDEAGAQFIVNSGTIKKLDVKGEVYWYQKENDHTQVRLKLATKDVGGIQREWRMKPAIEAEKGRGDVFIDWLGNPAQFNLESLTGDVNFKLQDGSFIDVKDTEALNAFGLLNVASIGRRLRLDFRDLYTEGLAFDRFEAKTHIESGLLTIIDTMNMEGPAAKFSINGDINLVTKELDQELSVTFPVSSTLPLVAILAGFAPPVAASIFVGERLVGDEIERFTSATYDVTGPWDDPKLELKKRFDNEIEGKKERSLWHRMKDVFGIGKD